MSNIETITTTREAAADELRELESLVEVLGDDTAQHCAEGHMLPQLVEATQRGYWKA